MPPRGLSPGRSNGDRKSIPTAPMLEQADDGLLAKPRLFYQAALRPTRGVDNLVAQTHDYQSNPNGHRVNPAVGDNFKRQGYLSPMSHPKAPKVDPWPQRQKFRVLVDKALEDLAKKHPRLSLDDRKAMLAEAMDSTPNALKQYYSGRVKTPGRGMLERMAAALGCLPGDLMSNPKRFTKQEEVRPEVESFLEFMFAVAKEAPASELEAMKKMVQAGQEMRRGKK